MLAIGHVNLSSRGTLYCDLCYFSYSYGSTLDEDNLREATVSCQPENSFAIESSDATVILGKRGNSLIPLDSELLSIDNKLQPYAFQTYAGTV